MALLFKAKDFWWLYFSKQRTWWLYFSTPVVSFVGVGEVLSLMVRLVPTSDFGIWIIFSPIQGSRWFRLLVKIHV